MVDDSTDKCFVGNTKLTVTCCSLYISWVLVYLHTYYEVKSITYNGSNRLSTFDREFC